MIGRAYGGSGPQNSNPFRPRVGEYLTPIGTIPANSIPAITATAYFVPFAAPSGMVADRLFINLGLVQVGAACRVGLYSHNYATGEPDDLLATGAEIDLSATTGLKGPTISLALPPLFWGCVHLKDVATQATMSSIGSTSLWGQPFRDANITGSGSSRGYTVNATYGALPAKASTLGTLVRGSAVTTPTLYVRRA